MARYNLNGWVGAYVLSDPIVCRNMLHYETSRKSEQRPLGPKLREALRDDAAKPGCGEHTRRRPLAVR
jgi:hypothetical protein